MAIELQYRGEVKDGQLEVHDRLRMKTELASLNDKKVEIIIREKYNKRTTPQNKFYWGVLIEKVRRRLIELTGENHKAEDIHDYLKQRFNSKEIVNEDTGQCINLPVSTTMLDVVDFILYLDKCKEFAQDFLGIDIDEGDL